MVTIASYENDDGDSIVCEFVNGNLTQRNIVFHDQNGIIVCEYYNANGDVQYTKQMNSSDLLASCRRMK